MTADEPTVPCSTQWICKAATLSSDGKCPHCGAEYPASDTPEPPEMWQDAPEVREAGEQVTLTLSLTRSEWAKMGVKITDDTPAPQVDPQVDKGCRNEILAAVIALRAESAALRDALRDERAATNLLLAGLRDEVANATPDSPQTMVDKLHAATAKLFAPDTERE